LIDRSIAEKRSLCQLGHLCFVGLGLPKVYEYCKSEPINEQGRFRTEVFERYQRREKVLVADLAEMCKGYRRGR